MLYALTASLIAVISAEAFYYSSPQPKVYSFSPNATPAAPGPVFRIEGVNALSGIAEVGQDAFVVTGGVFDRMYQNNAMNLSLLKFNGRDISISTVFQKSKCGPVNGILAIPRHKHIILTADTERGEILRIDTTIGHVGVAIKCQALAPVHGGPSLLV
ncbi:hypothetical protein FBULB1_1075 [Fusarium bulbicola]|nr:hypothetical protein FBULB1_1075 [Fusarium bulbicola]